MEVGASGLLDQIHASLSLLHNSLKHTVGPVHLLSDISGSKETFNILFEGLMSFMPLFFFVTNPLQLFCPSLSFNT